MRFRKWGGINADVTGYICINLSVVTTMLPVMGYLTSLAYVFLRRKTLPEMFPVRGVKLLASVDISTRDPWITLNEQHIMACTSTKLMNCTGMQDSSELDALKWKKEKEEKEEEEEEEEEEEKKMFPVMVQRMDCAHIWKTSTACHSHYGRNVLLKICLYCEIRFFWQRRTLLY
jgi:hypothetical protein